MRARAFQKRDCGSRCDAAKPLLPQDLLHVWTEPKLCIGGAALPRKKTVPCEGMEFWVQLGAEVGAITAVLLVSLTCYFWKKNKR